MNILLTVVRGFTYSRVLVLELNVLVSSYVPDTHKTKGHREKVLSF